MDKKFSENILITLDDSHNKIGNKDTIISEINKIIDLEELDNVRKYFENKYRELHGMIDSNEWNEIANVINERTSKIKNGEVDLQEDFNKIKEQSNNLKNISIIQTKKENNDKINGLKANVNYLQININGEQVLYEIENINGIFAYLKNNEEKIRNMSEEELATELSKYGKKINTTEIDRNSDNLTGETVKKEMKDINSSYIENAANEQSDVILKEKLDFKEFVDLNMPGEKIEYGYNSYGERIYSAGGRSFKFAGEERKLQEITKSNTENDITANFETYKSGNGSVENLEYSEYKTLSDFNNDSVKNNIEMYITALNEGLNISQEQIEFMSKFLNLYVSKEQEIELLKRNNGNESLIIEKENQIGDLASEFDKFYEFYKNNSASIKNQEIKDIMERQIELDKSKGISFDKVKVLELKNDKPLSPLEQAGFISVAIILEASAVIGGILAFLALVKK